MNRYFFKASLAYALIACSSPVQAMFSRLSQAALRPSYLSAGTRFDPAMLKGKNLQPRPTLLARTLATQHFESQYSRQEDQYDESQESKTGSKDSRSNWQNWRTFFSRVDKAQIIGGTILGWHLWWSDSDICQTPEDFEDIKKLHLTKKFIEEFPHGYDPRNIHMKHLIQRLAEGISTDPRLAQALAPIIVNNFAVLRNSPAWEIIFVVLARKIIDYPGLAKACEQPVIDNFATLAKDSYGRFILIMTVKAQPAIVASFVQPTLENFTALAKDLDGRDLIRKIMELNPEHAALFIQPVVDNFATIVTTSAGRDLIMDIMKLKPDTAAAFAQLAIDNFSSLAVDRNGHKVIFEIMNSKPGTIDTFESLATKHACKDIQDLIAPLRIKESIKEPFESAGTTQTSQHFLALLDHNLKKIETFFPKEENSIRAFKNMVGKIVATERIEQVLGNYTFVHAYPWNIRFLQDIDAQLRSIVYDTLPQPLSLRFIKPPQEVIGNKHETMRKDILANGVSRYYARDGKKQKYMIFMNYALLTNQHGSNTLQYIANDRCENPPHVLLDKIFKHLDLERYHTKYQQDFEELERLHREASMFGAGILFSFTPEMLKESVYVCKGGGGKRKVRIEGIGETDDVKLILDTLRTAPEKITDLDHLEFVFVVTKDCGLNPRVQESEDLKIIPFNAADPEKLKLYELKRDELIAKIKADFQAELASWSEYGKMQRETELQKMQQWFATFNCLNDCTGSRVQDE